MRPFCIEFSETVDYSVVIMAENEADAEEQFKAGDVEIEEDHIIDRTFIEGSLDIVED